MRLNNPKLICTHQKHFVAFFMLLLAVGCSSHIDKVTPKNMKTMDQLYDEKTGAVSSEKVRRRTAEIQARPLSSREKINTLPPLIQHVKELYPKLPNPELFMYVKPHVTGESGMVVPGYFTRFTLYEKTHYAMPGEALGSSAPLMLKIEQQEQKQAEEKAKQAKPHATDKYGH
jgi:conjugative transfer region lipoprotein (TIGR03751 family)